MDSLSSTFSELRGRSLACSAFQLSFPAPSVESWGSVSACEMQAGKGRKSKRKARMKAQPSHQRRADGAWERRPLSWSPRGWAVTLTLCQPSPSPLSTWGVSRGWQGPAAALGTHWRRWIPSLEAPGRSLSPEPTLPEGPRHRDTSLSLKISQHSAPGTSEWHSQRVLTTFANVQFKTQAQKITGKEVESGDNAPSAGTHSQGTQALTSLFSGAWEDGKNFLEDTEISSHQPKGNLNGGCFIHGSWDDMNKIQILKQSSCIPDGNILTGKTNVRAWPHVKFLLIHPSQYCRVVYYELLGTPLIWLFSAFKYMYSMCTFTSHTCFRRQQTGLSLLARK